MSRARGRTSPSAKLRTASRNIVSSSVSVVSAGRFIAWIDMGSNSRPGKGLQPVRPALGSILPDSVPECREPGRELQRTPAQRIGWNRTPGMAPGARNRPLPRAHRGASPSVHAVATHLQVRAAVALDAQLARLLVGEQLRLRAAVRVVARGAA